MATTTEPRTASVSVTVGDQELTFESGKLAKQADGAVSSARARRRCLRRRRAARTAREGADFFPLTVDVEERMCRPEDPRRLLQARGRPTERRS